MKKRDQLKFLLIQIRKDDESLEREFDAFVTLGKLDANQMDVWQVFKNPHFNLENLKKYDAVFAGGSSDDPKDAVILDKKEFPFITDAMKVFLHCKEQNIPVFASCMGLEIIMQAIDEPLVFVEENPEMGFSEIHLTEEGTRDPLFAGIAEAFSAVSWHVKQCKAPPKGSVVLASTEACPVHTFKFKNTKFYAFQFHPEWSDAALIELLREYAERYPGGVASYEKVKAERKTTTVANSLVAKFIDDVVLVN